MWGLSLFGVFVLAKLVAVAGGPVAWSAWFPVTYFWQDALIASLFGVIECRVASRRWVAGAYWSVVVYTVVNVLVVRELATPLTGRMLAAARGALADSIVHHAAVSNGLLAALLLATAAVLSGLSRRLSRSAIRRAAVASLVLVLAGLLVAPAVGTRGLHRNALDRYGNVAAGRNLVIVVLESTAAQYLRPYGAADDPMPHLTRFAAESLIFDATYAVYPASIKGLIATLFATNPGFGTTAAYREHVRNWCATQLGH